MNIDDWLKVLSGTAGAIACMLFGIKWLVRDRDGILASLQEERSHRITQLEASANSCAEDRRTMHNEMNELQKEVRALMKQMLELTATHKQEVQNFSRISE